MTEPDKSGISLIQVKNEKDIATFRVDELSQQLWGRPVPRRYPIYVVFHHGKPVGFFLACQQTVIYPALHPEFMTAKEFIKVNRSLITEMKRMAGDPIFMLCSKVEKVGAKTLASIKLKHAEEHAFVYSEEGC
jgi:hypothetical protein